MKKILITIFLIMNTISLFPLTIVTAPLPLFDSTGKATDGEEIRDQLVSLFRERYPGEDFGLLDGPAPGTFLEALEVCRKQNINYLFYGFLEEKETFLYGELKLFDREKGEIVKIFYSADSPGEEARLIRDLGTKAAAYLDIILDAPAALPETEETGLFSLALSGGYWSTFSPEWYGYLTSLTAFDGVLRFTPRRPAEGFYFSTGLGLHFDWAVNAPGYETFNLFTFRAGLPWTLFYDLPGKHTISLTAEPLFSVDYLVRERMFDDTVKSAALFFSGAAEVTYTYRWSPDFSFGAGQRIQVDFLDPLRVVYSPRLTAEWKLYEKEESKK